MIKRSLDLDAVRTFVLIAELGSFTHAAEATQSAQSTVSLKLKRLEKRLGCKLFVRTPRYVELSAQGTTFLEHAREFLNKHDRALAALIGSRQRLSIGISDHVAGPELPVLIARMNAHDPLAFGLSWLSFSASACSTAIVVSSSSSCNWTWSGWIFSDLDPNKARL